MEYTVDSNVIWINIWYRDLWQLIHNYSRDSLLWLLLFTDDLLFLTLQIYRSILFVPEREHWVLSIYENWNVLNYDSSSTESLTSMLEKQLLSSEYGTRTLPYHCAKQEWAVSNIRCHSTAN